MSEMSVYETLILHGALGASRRPLGEALSAAHEAQRLRGAYEQFVAISQRDFEEIGVGSADASIFETHGH